MKCIIVTGLSGAGRSQTLRQLEDMGYFCVDNMPPRMLSTFIKTCQEDASIDRVAVVIDTRARVFFNDIYKAIDDVQAMGVDCDVLFLETTDEVLIRRYKESRRKHPMNTLNIAEGIAKERRLLQRVRDLAMHIIDTSFITNRQLGDMLWAMYAESARGNDLMPVVVSFGFKNGIPLDADLVFDVRFLPNPFYIPELKALSGLEKAVSEYVFSFPQTQSFMQKLYAMIYELLPYYKEEGKYQLVIAIGCTGGRHRSVAVAERLYHMLIEDGIRSVVQHRDRSKDVIDV